MEEEAKQNTSEQIQNNSGKQLKPTFLVGGMILLVVLALGFYILTGDSGSSQKQEAPVFNVTTEEDVRQRGIVVERNAMMVSSRSASESVYCYKYSYG
jgi:hypothetical protein